MIRVIFLNILILLLCFSCAKEKVNENLILEDDLEEQMIAAYKEGMYELEVNNDVIYAVRKFNEAELLYPQSDWAPRAALMAAYAYYAGNYYSDSIYELEKFINTYPNHKNLDYAYFLLSMNHYQTIVDEKKDLKPILEAKKNFIYLLKKYPNTDYAEDAKYKIDLLNNILAAKEVYIARHYMKKQKWIPAINRFKTVIEDYDTTIFAEEALHRLVEINYNIGLEGEAKKYAKLLGYNYQSSEWYKQSYKILNKDYKIEKPNKLKDKKRLKNFVKRLFK